MNLSMRQRVAAYYEWEGHSKQPMDPDDHYRYPSAASEFWQYNFHRPAIIDRLTDILVSRHPDSPRIIELAGEPYSGRHYVLRAAVFQAQQRGQPIALASLDLSGYEPDQPLGKLVEHLSKDLDSAQTSRLQEIAKRGRVELKVTPLTFLFTSLAIKWDASLEELSKFLQSGRGPAGPEMSDRERLRRLLERVTQRRRLVVHVRDAQILDVALRARLIDEAVLNSSFYLALSFPSGNVRLGEMEHPIHRVQVPQWTRQEMTRAIRRDFSPSRVPSDFLDFLWQLAPQREMLAAILLRISTGNGPWVVASVDEKGTWIVEQNWMRNKQLLTELARDLFDPVDQLLQRLRGEEPRLMRQFLNLAALCDPTIPVKRILSILDFTNSDADEFLDRVDALLGDEGELPIFQDCGFSNPGFPKTELVYRFRNPALPSLILKRCPNPDELAVQLLNRIAGVLRPSSRSVATLYLRLAETAGTLAEAERYRNLLVWWTSVEEGETLTAAAVKTLAVGDVSPALMWTVSW